MWKGSLRDIPTENHHPTPQLQLVTFSSVFWFYCWQLHCLVPSSSSTLFPDSRQLFWAKKKSSKNTLHTTCSADGKVSWLVKTQILCLTSWWSPDLSLNESEYWTYILQARSPETSGYRGTPVLWYNLLGVSLWGTLLFLHLLPTNGMMLHHKLIQKH